jgi:dsDNA-specific endonuclease/ATPase MutS2
MIQLKGGRGKKAPYTTTQVRCPDPVKPLVEAIIREFRESGEVPQNPQTRIQELREKIALLEKELENAEASLLKYYRATHTQGKQPELSGQEDNPPYTSKNPPKQGDRFKSLYGKVGTIEKIQARNPKYLGQWDNGEGFAYTIGEIETLGCRKLAHKQ